MRALTRKRSSHRKSDPRRRIVDDLDEGEHSRQDSINYVDVVSRGGCPWSICYHSCPHSVSTLLSSPARHAAKSAPVTCSSGAAILAAGAPPRGRRRPPAAQRRSRAFLAAAGASSALRRRRRRPPTLRASAGRGQQPRARSSLLLPRRHQAPRRPRQGWARPKSESLERSAASWRGGVDRRF